MQAQHSPNEWHLRDDLAHIATHFSSSGINWHHSSCLLQSRSGQPQTAVGAMRRVRVWVARLNAETEATILINQPLTRTESRQAAPQPALAASLKWV